MKNEPTKQLHAFELQYEDVEPVHINVRVVK